MALLLTPAHPLRAANNLNLAEFGARGSSFTALALSDDGKYLFTGEDYGLITLWSVTTGTTVYNYPGHVGHVRGVFAAALLPDGKRGVTCGDDDKVIVWDLPTGKRLHEMSTGNSIPWVMSCTRDGALAATGCNDGQIMVWDIATGARVTTLPPRSQVYGILFSPDGKLLAAGYADGQVILWNVSDWSQRHLFPSTDGATVGALAFSPDSRLLATGDQNGAGFVWRTGDGTQLSHFAGYANPEAPPNPPVAPVFPGSTVTPDNRGAIVYVCFSPDASSVMAAVQDEVPRFWDTRSGKLLGTADWYGDNRFYVPRYGYPFAATALTPDGKYIVTLKKDGDMDDYLAEVWIASYTPIPIPR